MRFLLAGFVLVAITFGCATGARPNVGGLLSQLSQLHSVMNNFPFPDNFKDKVTQIILSGIANSNGVNSIINQIQNLFQQQQPQVYPPQERGFNFGSFINSITPIISAVTPIIVSALGKRDVGTELTERKLQQLYDLVDKLDIEKLIPQISGFLNGAQLQQMQGQLWNLVADLVNGNTQIGNVAQMVQGLLAQFLPRADLGRDFWSDAGNAIVGALPHVVSAIPTIVSIFSLFGKRDLEERINYQQLLAQLPVDKIAKLIKAVLDSQGSIMNALANLRPLVQQFFAQYQGRIDFQQMTQHILGTLVSNIPQLGGLGIQNLISGISGIFGKRDASQLTSLFHSINLADLLPQIESFIHNNVDLEHLQSQFITLLISGIANHTDIKDLGQMLFQLVQHYIPSIGLQRIDWGNLIAQAIPVVTSVISLFGK